MQEHACWQRRRVSGNCMLALRVAVMQGGDDFSSSVKLLRLGRVVHAAVADEGFHELVSFPQKTPDSSHR